MVAERAFASACAAQGIKTGFLSYLAGDAVVFRPRPVSGVGWYAQSPETEARLSWEPVYADVSAAADLGYTTGPWTFSGEDGKPSAFGEYVSVWRKRPGTGWKVAIDVGVTHPAPDRGRARAPAPRYAAAGSASGADSAGGKAERRRLSAASQEFFRAWSAGSLAAAYREHASGDVLVLREGAFPARGLSEAVSVVGREEIPSAIEAMGGGLAASGDLGYTYGVIGWRGDAREASYLWVWKRTGRGSWKIVVDVMVPCGSEDQTGE